MSASTRIAGLGVHLPERVRATTETEQRLRAENPGMKLATGLISRMTGVERVHIAPDDWQASDLAVAASRQALDESPGDIDLVLFTAAAQDLVEPATSHIVAAKLELNAPVMDVKNACNSVLNGMQVADALIRTGQYRRVLVASGEKTSVSVRWKLNDPKQFVPSFPGYVMGDAGAAVVLEASDDPEAGI
ncbi:MAG TPA: ketoacyl-ACP synthase III, partial [Pseudolysinimonas sp.]|nr:ketoacyl-ACP synthase III [Pseudolysinimonas sp.]